MRISSKPVSLSVAIEQLRDLTPDNATVKSITSTKQALHTVAMACSHLGAHTVMPMIQVARRSKSAIALYAGDGIVLKITDIQEIPFNTDFKPDENSIVPGVLPPIQQVEIAGHRVALYPWIDRKNVTESDVLTMKQKLASYNLKFKAGDDRRDNIGILPGAGHKLAVLDADAVELLNPHLGVLSTDSRQWERDIQSRFSPLYKTQYRSGDISLISKEPDFTEKYSPLLGRRTPAAFAIAQREFNQPRSK